MFLYLFTVLILLFFENGVYANDVKEEKILRNNTSVYTFRLYNSPVLKMIWVKLPKGGYMVSGKIPDSVKNKYGSCKYLTDFNLEELAQVVEKEYGFIDYKVYVRSLNAVVEPNREPVLAEPFNPNINPTITNDIYEINSYLKKEFERLIREDPNFRERFRNMIDNSIKNGLSHEEAQRIAKQHLAKSIELKMKKWIPEEKLPKRLYLLCTVSSYEVKNPDPRRYREIEYTYFSLYPVYLEVKRGNYIEITSLRKINDSDVELALSVYPFLEKEYLYLDLKTLNPPEVKLRGCSYGYIGGYVYNGMEPDERYRYEDYEVRFSTGTDGKFYLVVIPFEVVDKFSVYLRLDTYCSKEKKESVSLLNPLEGDKSPLLTSTQLSYKHKDFLRNFGIKGYKFKFRLISPNGYTSEPFEISLP